MFDKDEMAAKMHWTVGKCEVRSTNGKACFFGLCIHEVLNICFRFWPKRRQIVGYKFWICIRGCIVKLTFPDFPMELKYEKFVGTSLTWPSQTTEASMYSVTWYKVNPMRYSDYQAITSSRALEGDQLSINLKCTMGQQQKRLNGSLDWSAKWANTTTIIFAYYGFSPFFQRNALE